MSTKSREAIWGGQAANIRAEGAREAAKKAIREADRAEAEAWSVRMEGYGSPAQPSPTIGQCLNGGLGWLSRSSAIVVRRAQACRSTASAGQGTRRCGSWKRR